jgi:hypothetical protein
MRVTEATWIASELARIGPEALSPLVNIGSSTEEFRTVRQPHIDRVIFAPLRAANVEVIHSDLKAQAGVDIAGDLLDPATQAAIRSRKPRAVLCSNLLEHVLEPKAFARAMTALLAPGGFAIVTVPRSYPFHADPIDTGLRPTPEEIANLFSDCELVRSEVVADVTYGDELRAKGVRRGVRQLLGAARPWGDAARAQRDRLRWLFKPFTTSCAVLRVR